MSRNKGDIVRYSEAELRAMRDAAKTRGDWDAAAQKPIPDGSDPDDAMEPVAWATTELPMPKRKEHINLRIDADVLGFFRGQGKGYQTKINAVLRSYVEQMTMRERAGAEAPASKFVTRKAPAVSRPTVGEVQKGKAVKRATKVEKVGPHHSKRRAG